MQGDAEGRRGLADQTDPGGGHDIDPAIVSATGDEGGRLGEEGDAGAETALAHGAISQRDGNKASVI